jgi:formylglycine-generating enzyme required for sulfatase activity
LFEFAHLGSGDVPARDPGTNRLILGEDFAIVLVLVPGGTFRMGAQKMDATGPNYDALTEDGEGPVHEVRLSPYFIGKFEVTQAQWECLTDGARPSVIGSGTYAGKRVTPRHPVEGVSWDECATWLGRHELTLPTEAQWENACRAATNTPWWCSHEAGSMEFKGNLNGHDGYAVHAPVGSFSPNGFGLHDVHGNVWEWCRDTWGVYSVRQVTDPVRQGTGDRVIRGGSFESTAADARSARRAATRSSIRGHASGVRAARTVTGG